MNILKPADCLCWEAMNGDDKIIFSYDGYKRFSAAVCLGSDGLALLKTLISEKHKFLLSNMPVCDRSLTTEE